MSLLKLFPTLIIKFILNSFYRCLCFIFKVNRNRVVFASYRSTVLKDNLFYVYNEMRNQFPEKEAVLLFATFKGGVMSKVKYTLHMLKGCYYLATSGYFIVDDYYMLLYLVKPRKEVQVIQLWHSAGALKQFGLSTVGKPFGPSANYVKHVPVHGNYSKAYVSATEVIPFFANAFGMEEHRIKPLGIPRSDFFYNESEIQKAKHTFYRKYPMLSHKKLLLYAPTYRGKSHHQEAYQVPLDLNKLKMALEGEYALLIHLHPYMRNDVVLQSDEEHFVFPIVNEFSIQELLVIADILITDYSAVFFEYSLLHKPMIFYPYDMDDYQKERDFYYDYQSLVPGPIVRSTEELIDVLRNNSLSTDTLAAFQSRFFDHLDGMASERVVQDIFS
ncbi:CDP-glycerol glycerophosphotransferase family protein [Virgibacillus sp. LDC-1]|uniref:CDP-glycerol glycerophosphotransferase family protein n=1 Tax=Virgibacillus sp. LDC-1 TaxID=3039856 RepID=UPI0024DED4DF|nr:CDP-glycerol glycerophosphotransferase family protein [Virgibacillus sp. LDC-1]